MPLENRQLITGKLANNELKTIDTVYSNKTASPSDLRVAFIPICQMVQHLSLKERRTSL